MSSHQPILYQQVASVRDFFPVCIDEVARGIDDDIHRTNRDLLISSSAIFLGTVLQVVGGNVNAPIMDAGDLAADIGFTLVRLSFIVPRLYALKPNPLADCTFGDPNALLDEVAHELQRVSCGFSTPYKNYKAKSLKMWIRESLSCLSSGSGVGTRKINDLTGLFTDLKLMTLG